MTKETFLLRGDWCKPPIQPSSWEGPDKRCTQCFFIIHQGHYQCVQCRWWGIVHRIMQGRGAHERAPPYALTVEHSEMDAYGRLLRSGSETLRFGGTGTTIFVRRGSGNKPLVKKSWVIINVVNKTKISTPLRECIQFCACPLKQELGVYNEHLIGWHKHRNEWLMWFTISKIQIIISVQFSTLKF